MKLIKNQENQGFTLGEMMMAVTIGSFILAAAIGSSVSLQKSFSAVENYFSAHIQQIRVIDYLSRDVKRSYIVNTSVDKLTVNCTVPNYIVPNGGVGTRGTPTLSFNQNAFTVNYPGSRVVTDAVTTSGSTTLTSATAAFTASDVGQQIAGSGIPAGATIQSYTATTATLSSAATASATALAITIGGISTVVYSVTGNTIVRTENGSVTTIAASTDQLLPQTTDVQTANTEYTATTITFKPTFNFSAAPTPTPSPAPVDNARAGTTAYATAYLRNLRRGN